MINISSVVVLLGLFTGFVSSFPHQESGRTHKSRNAPGPVVDLGYAKYQGSTDLSTNISIFSGIRYAGPPTGSLRFQAPQAPAKVDGVQQATSPPPQCYQAGEGTAQTNPFIRNPLLKKRYSTLTSEDCFVSVPDIGMVDGLPVVVWIHGGGYGYHSHHLGGNISVFPQEDLVVDSQNHVIVVSIQYRLGAFGFLAGPSVKKSGALNAGLLDQHFALQWVQQYYLARYIGSFRLVTSLFGGDPSKVTIWGESVGAGSVLQHVVAYGGRTNPPLFRAAITSSTYLPPQYAANDPIPTVWYRFLPLTSCDSASDTFACLLAVDSDTLNNANDAIASSAFYGTFVFVPVVDGTFIVERPTVTLDRQVVNGDVLLSVTNTFEGRTFTIPSETNTFDFIRQLFPFLSAKQIDLAAGYYTALNSTLPTPLDQSIAIMGESIFICPTYLLLKAFNGKSWKGEFAIPPGNHGDDVYYYFLDNNPPFNNADFIKSFSQSFMNIAVSLDPNRKFDPTNPTPAWDHWNSDETEMLFNKTSTDGPDIRAVRTDSRLLERCAYVLLHLSMLSEY
ncbi:hypothetical protein PILCRDRAFT_74653 [Piloderma croceum F 1598]|uniref:Carboxylesterase type B domain-containing protein n=1 Tax=Piloderma croceum (strain F 1598) TaxID=765440 RepID=A0A0C3AYQ3_PILCF|nr:hypothetical protein PILCRDRAFT_74653 [Piloderma croceum F 1598]